MPARLKAYCVMTGSGPGPSISEGSLAASQQDKLWVVDTLPTQWTRPVQTAAGPGRMLEKRSTCELEADACVEHVLNRAEVRCARPTCLSLCPLRGLQALPQYPGTLLMVMKTSCTQRSLMPWQDTVMESSCSLPWAADGRVLCSWCATSWRRWGRTSAWWSPWRPCGTRSASAAEARGLRTPRPTPRATPSRCAPLWTLSESSSRCSAASPCTICLCVYVQLLVGDMRLAMCQG